MLLTLFQTIHLLIESLASSDLLMAKYDVCPAAKIIQIPGTPTGTIEKFIKPPTT